jgi:alkanesulfonate monooxygenase SsuD/methylene tetrahydromethanopterin reductase-like flavin-dependent oxidoreductase (luciferase family)
MGAPMMTARIPLARVRERMDLYEAGLAESGLDAATRRQRREEAAVWRFAYVAESQAQAEDELGAALFETRRHMVHARSTHNPLDYRVEPSRINPWNDPHVSHEDGVRYSLETAALCGTAKRVADQVAELRDAGAHHVLCQMTCGYLPHAQVMESMRSFGEDVIPRFR